MTGPRVTADDLAGLRRKHAEYVAAFNADVPREQWLTDVGSAAVGVCEAFPALIDRAESAERDLAAAQTQLAALTAAIEAGMSTVASLADASDQAFAGAWLVADAMDAKVPGLMDEPLGHLLGHPRAALAEGPAPETTP